VVIDNASTDKTAEYLAAFNMENVKIITNKVNHGFARACNQGAKEASAKYLLFLNNDTEVQEHWVEPLIKILDNDPVVAAAGSKLLYPDKTIQHAGVIIIDNKVDRDPLLARHIYINEESTLPEANIAKNYQALTAACLLVKKSRFEAVGGFDEGYWNGYEDVDLCFKLGKMGWKIVYQPESVVVHHESKSGPERFAKARQNIKRLHTKWLGKIAVDMVLEKDGTLKGNPDCRVKRYTTPVQEESRPVVSMIILAHNALEYTKKCVASIQTHTEISHEIIFVDNASTDGTQDYLEMLT